MTYLDHAASTPTRPEVVETMMPWFTQHPGNPSGAHHQAREARRAVDEARDAVAALVGADSSEVVFTSGGTEADNLAIDGVLRAKGGTPICTATEHPAVLEPVRDSGGMIVPTDQLGQINLETFTETLDSVDNISLVSAMTANNETGIINPVTDIATLLQERSPETFLHTDAVQATAWLDLVKHCEGAHLVSITGHKFGGPKGAGALIVKKGVPFAATQRGGGQERERRSGTQNVPAIVGLGKAAQLIMNERETLASRVTALRDRLEEELIALVPDTFRTLPQDSNRTPQIAHLCFKGVESESLLFLLEQEGIAASAGSSCASGAQQASHVLHAMGIDYETAAGSIRLSLGWTTTEEEINHALTVIPAAVTQLREYPK